MQTKVLNWIAGLFAVIVAVALAIHAWGSFTGGSSPTASSKLERGAITVQIRGLAYPDGVRTVAVGTKVTWTNDDGAVHTVTAADRSFDSDKKAQGETFSHTFTSIGQYAYTCTIHPFMKGTITVVQPYGG
jgi:plastocyanin